MSGESNENTLDYEWGDNFRIDFGYLMSMSKNEINVIIKELRQKMDSFSTAYLAQKLEIDIDTIDAVSKFFIYLLHIYNSYGLSFDMIQKRLNSFSSGDRDKITEVINQLKSFDENTLERIEAFYFAYSNNVENNTILRIRSDENYVRITDTNEKLIGLSPSIRIKMEMWLENGGEVKIIDSNHTLDSLKSLIWKLNEIYNEASNNAKDLKSSSNLSIVCLPSEE